MKKLSFVFTLAFVGIHSFSGCRTGSNTSQKDSSLYLNDSIQIGDTVINLIGKGWVVPDPEYKDMYVKTQNGGVEKAHRPITMRDLFTMSAGFSYALDTDGIKKAHA